MGWREGDVAYVVYDTNAIREWRVSRVIYGSRDHNTRFQYCHLYKTFAEAKDRAVFIAEAEVSFAQHRLDRVKALEEEK